MIIFVYKKFILNLAFAFWTRFVIDLICYYPNMQAVMNYLIVVL